MAKNPKSAPANAPKTATAATDNGKGDKPAKPKRAKVRLISKSIPGLWVRAFVDVIEKYGTPLDPKGVAMVPGKPPVFGMSAEQRAERKSAKDKEKARIDAMSDEEKLAYAAKIRVERQEKRAAKKAAERDALIKELKAEIAAGKI